MPLKDFCTLSLKIRFNMSASLLRGELNSEISNLNKRYESTTKKAQSSKTSKVAKSSCRKKFKNKYKRDSRIDRLVTELGVSKEESAKREEEEIERNAQRLESSSKDNVVSFEDIFQSVSSSKRYYEPKGRNMLKKPVKKNTNKISASAFSESDFEEFKQAYFPNSGMITKKANSNVE